MSRTSSFRDPGGFVSVSKERVIRTVLAEGRANLEAYLNSPAAKQLVADGRLIETHRLSDDEVEHPVIPFRSYAHEWPAAMLHAAGELTLEICAALLEEGRGLKDATPANVLFRGTRPVFIDVLSFEQRDPLDSIWLADGQFARTFLIPLLLHQRTGAPIHEMFVAQRDGVRPEEALRRLPRVRRWFPPDLGLVTMPAKAARLEKASLYQPHRAREAGEAKFILARRFRALQKKLVRLAPQAERSAWSNYEAARPSYDQEQLAAKRAFVERVLRDIRPARVLDVGSNTGEFSLMAAASGASVIAIDNDAESVAALWRTAASSGADILPLVVDFARPTPALGWRGRENAGFLERAESYFDCVMGLAVTHHLMVSDQIPLREIFDLLAALTTKWLVIEYVGPEDSLFRRLTRGREDLYRWYSRAAFEDCAGLAFETVKAAEIPRADRAIYLLRRKG